MSATAFTSSIAASDEPPLVTARGLSFHRGDRIIFQNVDLIDHRCLREAPQPQRHPGTGGFLGALVRSLPDDGAGL
jgi:hypothetical protein